jgi:hypothetical protein
LVFCGANLDHLHYLLVLFVCFEVVFGLKVNLAKSVLVLVGNVKNVDGLAGILGCGTFSLPLKYLGLPLGAYYKVKSIWDGIVVKIECWLASWKMMCLPKGGRVPFIKSTLTYVLISIPHSCWSGELYRVPTRFFMEG